MKRIPLTKGYFALVDDEDFDYLNQWKWQFNSGYANRVQYERIDRGIYRNKSIRMHRDLMSAPNNMQVDHIDGDKLNNQKANLRICTAAQNSRNRRPHVDGTSEFKGVYYDKKTRSTRKWKAQITLDYKNYNIGRFSTQEEAAAAYDRKSIELHGEYGRRNA
jgi:hypothetical protein